MKLGSRRQSRRRKEREPRGRVPATPPVSEEETALRERLAELERDADLATRQRAAEVYWDTYDAERVSGGTVTDAILAAYRARIAMLEGAGDHLAPDLDAEFDNAAPRGADAGDDRGAQNGGAFADLEPAIDAMRARFGCLAGEGV